MGREQTVSGMRLRLLAFVLAMALAWYAMNPAPGPARWVRKTEEPPDEARRNAENVAANSYRLDLSRTSIAPPHAPASLVGEGTESADLEWPEVIDL